MRQISGVIGPFFSTLFCSLAATGIRLPCVALFHSTHLLKRTYSFLVNAKEWLRSLMPEVALKEGCLDTNKRYAMAPIRKWLYSGPGFSTDGLRW